MAVEFSSIPEPADDPASLLEAVQALKQCVEALVGRRGSDASKAVSKAEFDDTLPIYGVWTPTIGVGTLGDLTVVYGSQFGVWRRVNKYVEVYFNFSTSTWTWTTASGQVTIEGLPFKASHDFVGTFIWSGITKANYTQFAPVTATDFKSLAIECSGSGVGIASLQIADIPTGGGFLFRGSVTYEIVV